MYVGAAVQDSFNTPGIDDGNWHHVAVTFNGADTAALYIDGTNVAVAINSIETMSLGGMLRVGSNTILDFKGEMDDLYIYNNVLTAGQISALYALGAASVSSPLSPKGYIALALSFLGLAWHGNRRRELHANHV